MGSNGKTDRYVLLISAIVLLFIVIVVKLFDLQIIKADYYGQQADNRLMRNVSISAPRGDILDRHGRPIVTSKEGFSVVLYKEYIKDEDLDELILRIIDVLEQNGEKYFDTLPISKTEPFFFEFPGKSGEQYYNAINEFLEENDIPKGTDAKLTLRALKEHYKIKDGYSANTVRKLVGVRYEMEQRLFNRSNPYTFASDVSINVVTEIKEKHQDFIGVDIFTQFMRSYPYGNLASHLLGRVGIIYQDEYEQLKGQDYGMNDIIGKDGIEKYMEKYLKGKDGVSSVVQNIDGKTSGVLETVSPTPGNNVFLTIDLKLQQVLEKSLKDTINNIRGVYGANAGSAVVIDVKTGEILAMASYPDYSIENFNENYNSMINNPDLPMWNRAISGQYAPGSTFKILTAIAGLESGSVSSNETIYDEGVYRYYESSNYTPVCWIYSSKGKGHGSQNVTEAIENSCNYYFYETGRRMGIDTLDDYAEKFGFGDYTGLHFLGESKGVLASREYKEDTFGEKWYPGDTLQASIGQSYHLFTPIQLANYIATVANGGVRYKTTLVKSVKNSVNGNSILETKPEIAYEIEIEDNNYKAVVDGMKKVSESGTASDVFATFEVPVAGKTGTADVSSGSPTGLFVAFAPIDNPQIAISVVVEHGGHGNYVAPVARDVISAYMESNKVDDLFVGYDSLIK
ncbi:MAG: penicillin-binding protein 2 [Clostridia bacterium]|nr:penicillin-binding protein 2 [Clostridia bacterium]MBQ9997890.1 penicillin-binding protein 2 [Clostridia bacterium]